MAFTSGTATDLEDLIADISTFLQANGWTEDRRDNAAGIVGWSKNSIFVSGRWDPADPQALSLHQATAALPASGTEPGDATGDSGNGYNTSSSHSNTNLRTERYVELGNGPFVHYAIFEQDASPAYVHIVVETSTDIFAHFGFGELDKVGDGWTGGEYCYGNVHESSTELFANSTWLLDGVFGNTSGNDERQAATIRISGFPSQLAGSVWGQVWGRCRNDANAPDDTAGNPKVGIQGGFRAGPFAKHWGVMSADKLTGMIPMYSIGCFYCDNVNDYVYFIGWQPDVRAVNMRGIAAKEQVVIGSDTWHIYPATQRDIGNGSGTTGYMGIAYKEVTA